MAIESRTVTKTHFETGDVPTQVEFENLIDSAIWNEDYAANNTIIYKNSSGVITSLTVANDRIIGRKSSGEIVALTGAEALAITGGGSGTVTAVSIASANGFAGSSSGGATPALTISTTITGVLKGNGTAISAAGDADITGKLLTGYVSGAGTVAATDSILQAIQKLNGNIAALGGGIPAGTLGQTLYYAANGTVVTPASNFSNDGLNVLITATGISASFNDGNQWIRLDAANGVGININPSMGGLHVTNSTSGQLVPLLRLDNTVGDVDFFVCSSNNSPEGVITGNVGDICIDNRNAGVVGMYIKADDANNTSWLKFVTQDSSGDVVISGKLTVTGAIDPTHLYLDEQAGDPSNVANKGILYTKDVGGLTQLFYMDSAGTVKNVSATGTGNALTSNPLSQFAATTSLELKGVISDETGSGSLVFATAPTFAGTVTFGTTPVLAIASGGVINFNSGDITITHTSNQLAFAGAASGYLFDTLIRPTTNDGTALGATSLGFSDLFLASGAVINFNNGNVTITHSAGALTIAGNISATNLSGTNTGDQTTVSGNAGSATVLQTSRNINGVAFDGSADITVTAAAGTLTGTTLAAAVVTSSLTAVGTIATGTWQGSVIGLAYGGSNKNMTAVNGGIVWTDADSMEVSAAGTAGQVLLSGGAAAPTWASIPIGILQCNMGSGNTMALSSTQYAAFGFGQSTGTNEAVRSNIITHGCTLKNFYLRTSNAQSGTGNMVVTLRKNAVATALTFTIAAGAAAGVFSDTTHSVTFAATDKVSIEMVNNATVVSANVLEIACSMYL